MSKNLDNILINIDLFSDKQLFNQFNRDEVAPRLNEYILDNLHYVNRKSNVTIKINTSQPMSNENQETIISLVKNSYRRKIESSNRLIKLEHIKEILLMLVGIIFIMLSFAVETSDMDIIKEVLEISGWVAVWESIYNILFTNRQTRFTIKKYKKILNSKIVFGLLNKRIKCATVNAEPESQIS